MQLLNQNKSTVMLVEDDARVRRYAKRLFQRLGYSVIEAENADIALEQLQNNSEIDLLFSDVVMPGNLDGFDLYCETRKLYQDLPIILTSGYNSSITSLNEKNGDFQFLQKPYDKKMLEETIQQIAP